MPPEAVTPNSSHSECTCATTALVRVPPAFPIKWLFSQTGKKKKSVISMREREPKSFSLSTVESLLVAAK